MKTYFIVFLWAFALLPTAFGQWYATEDALTGLFYHVKDGARNLQNARKTLQKQTKKYPNESYLMALYDLSTASRMMNLTKDAEMYLFWADKYAKDTLKNTHCEAYHKVLVGLGCLYLNKSLDEKDAQRSAFFRTKALSHIETFLAQDTINKGFSMHEYRDVAIFYWYFNDFAKEKYLLEKHLDSNPNLESENPVDYAFKLLYVADYYSIEGSYANADSMYQQVIKILGTQWAYDKYDWVYVLPNYITFLGRVEAVSECKKVSEQLETVIKGKETIGILNILGHAYHLIGEYQKAEKVYKAGIILALQESGKKTDPLQCLYGSLAFLYTEVQQYDKAIEYHEKTLNIALEGRNIDELLSKKNDQAVSNFIMFLNLSDLYIKLKNFDKALVNANYALRMSKLDMPKQDIAARLSNIMLTIQIYDAIYKYEKLDSLVEIIVNQLILKQANRLLQVTGSKPVQKHEFFVNYKLLSILSKRHQQIKNSSSLIYDYNLLYKSSNLQVRLEELVKRNNNNDPNIQQLYERWQTAQKELVNSLPNKRLDSVQNDLDNLQKQLSIRLRLRQDYFKQIHWKDVQNGLGKDSIAIEFMAVPDYDSYESKYSGDTLYYAVLLTAAMRQPQIIPLFEQRELLKLREQGDDFYQSPKAYQLIWAKIAPFAQGMQHIFYTPMGRLHEIVFPQLKTPKGDYLIDHHRWHLLTTTRLLTQTVMSMECLNQEQVVMAADINYDTHLQKNSANAGFRGSFDTIRGDITYDRLPKSRIESDSLQQICQRNAFPYQVISEQKATETHIKSLTENNPKPTVLILSTHAFFNSQDKHSINPQQLSEEPLMRCGIVFAGANQALRDKKIYIDADEGIWTGYEISESNLLDTKLVILSACETSKGEIQANEGIYGLHQAFKLAGAHYILASRKKVYDGDAKDFVVTFFRKAADGKMAIAEAFHQTQLEMKRNGRAWANWVLLK
jgi:CHAT domain-containing protein